MWYSGGERERDEMRRDRRGGPRMEAVDQVVVSAAEVRRLREVEDAAREYLRQASLTFGGLAAAARERLVAALKEGSSHDA